MARRLAPVVSTLLVSAVLAAAAPGGGSVLRDATAESGVDFHHRTGRAGEYRMPEISCGGVALLDADADGHLDVYLVQAARAAGAGDRLFLNRGSGDGPRFVDASAAWGLPEDGYGCGAATGDVDGDGRVDLLLTGADGTRLLRNRGDRFEDVTARAGAAVEGWSSSASFFDYDRDGDLDLWVARYLELPPGPGKVCRSGGGGRDYCHPDSYPGLPDVLLRNRGDGTFEDVSVAAGIDRIASKSLGVITADLDGDGRVDVYVANDGMANQLWLAQGDGTFRDRGLQSGAALDARGAPEASMGVVAEDLDGDLDLDLLLTHLTGESHTFYRNEGGGLFVDDTFAAGLGAASFAATGWGVVAFDPDRDGDLDLWVGNGAVRALEARRDAGDDFPFAQRDQLFRNLGGGRYEEWPVAVTEPLGVTRGVAAGDLDDDGATDLVLVQAEGPARVLLATPPDAGWIGLELLGEAGAPALGAEVRVEAPGGPVSRRRVHTDGSYASAGDPRILVAVPSGIPTVTVRVRWPDGLEEVRSDLATGRYHRLTPPRTSPGASP